MTDEKNGCGAKHFKLSCWIIGIVLSLATTTSISIGLSMGADAKGLEPRLRAVEQSSAAALVQNREILRRLDELRDDVKELRKEKK